MFLSAKLQGVVFTAIGVVALGLLCGAGWRIWFQGLSRFVLMLGIVGSVNLFFHPWGSPVTIEGWELPFTYDGVNSSVLLTVQLVGVIALSMVLTFTTTPMELTKACRRLAMPLKRLRVPVEELEIIMLLAMRFVPLLQGEVRLTVEAQRAGALILATADSSPDRETLLRCLYRPSRPLSDGRISWPRP